MTIERSPIEILFVEDDPTDILLIEEAFAASIFKHRLHVASDGLEAISFLRRSGKHTGAPRLDMVLLDLGLPVKNGFEVLKEIKTDKTLANIPVIVLSTLDKDADIAKAYAHYANCYIVKPNSYSRYCELIKAIENFWFNFVSLPNHFAQAQQLGSKF